MMLDTSQMITDAAPPSAIFVTGVLLLGQCLMSNHDDKLGVVKTANLAADSFRGFNPMHALSPKAWKKRARGGNSAREVALGRLASGGEEAASSHAFRIESAHCVCVAAGWLMHFV